MMQNAPDAAEHGATIHTRMRGIAIERLEDHWRVTVTRAASQTISARARSLVNAAGLWVKGLVGLFRSESRFTRRGARARSRMMPRTRRRPQWRSPVRAPTEPGRPRTLPPISAWSI
jgi:glycerol-3-phosphate dehydrogenase